MKLSKRYLFPGILSVIIIGTLCGYFYLNQSHRNIQEEEVSYTLTSSELEESFRNSEAHARIADQVIRTQGKITVVGEKSLTLDDKVEVRFISKLPDSLKKGNEVGIKGRCVGYDDLLQVVKVDQAKLIEPF